MALPVFDTPISTIALPSNGALVKFRPFLVKEQKQLLMAAQEGVDQQNDAIEGIINACTFGKVNANKLPSFDVEYLFIHIRAASVGEKVELVLTCPCGAKQDTALDVTKIKVDKQEDHKNVVELDNNISLTMRYPHLREIDELLAAKDVDGIIKLIAKSIETVWQGDEMFSAADHSVAEMIDFVESMSPQSLDKIEKFFATMPVIRHTVEWDCKECAKHNEVTLEGIQSFFA
jgi:hypothetical protein